MPETITEQTPLQQTEGQAQQASQSQQEGQVQQTADGQQVQAQEGAQTVDLLQIPLDQLTNEQIKELQQGYMRQSDYTKKTQELGKEKEGLTNYDALIQRPDFIQWATNKQAQFSQQTQAKEPDLSEMPEEEKVAYLVKKQLTPIAQSYYQDKQVAEDEKLATKYQGANYQQYVPKITQMQIEIARQPYLYREEAFKVLDYDNAQKRSFEAGRQEGLKGQQVRRQANIVQEGTSGSTVQREVIRGSDAIRKIWERAEQEGRTM